MCRIRREYLIKVGIRGSNMKSKKIINNWRVHANSVILKLIWNGSKDKSQKNFLPGPILYDFHCVRENK